MADERKIDIIKNGKPYSLLDIIAISASLVLCAILIVFSCATRKEGSTVIITESFENRTTEYNLAANREIVIKTAKGELIVVIENNTVYVKQSPCRGQDCVRHAAIRYSGQIIVCAEYRVQISITGEGGLIAVT